MKLYDYFRSSAAYRVRIALNLKGLVRRRTFVHLRKGEQRAPDYLALNPQGLVPALVDRRRHGAHAVARDHRVSRRAASSRRRCCRATPWSGRACAPSRWRSPATSTRSTTCACCNTSRGTLDVSDEQKNAWYRHWVDVGLEALETQLARERATGACCHGDTPTLADICLVPQLANARRFNDRPHALIRRCCASTRRAARCPRSPPPRPSASRTPSNPHLDDAARIAMNYVLSRVGPARVPVAGTEASVSRPPHLLRRPQLRRAREGDGRRCEQGAAVLLHQARRRGRPVVPPARSAACAIRWRPRTTITRSSWSSRSATRGVRLHAGARQRRDLRLRGRPRHDPARPAERHAREEAAVGHRQVVRAEPRRSRRSIRSARRAS